MKRIISILFVCCLAMSLISCTNRKVDLEKENNTNNSTQVEEKEEVTKDSSLQENQEKPKQQEEKTEQMITQDLEVENEATVQDINNQDLNFTSVEETVYAVTNVNVRSLPSIESESLGILRKNANLQRIGIATKWSKVIYQDVEGYIATEYLTTEEPSSSGAGHIVAIDAGHQAKGNSEQEPIGPGATQTKAKVASGTSGVVSGLAEYQLTLSVAMKVKQELLDRGYQVVMIRETNDVNLSNAKRAQIANESGAEAFVRIHANGSEDSNVHGLLTMCQTSANPYVGSYYEQSKRLSKMVLTECIATTNAADKGIIETDNMSGINWCNLPVTIIEMGFMTNKEEDALMATDEYQNKISIGIANGLDRFFENE